MSYFKEKYAGMWGIASRRERIVYSILKEYLPPKFGIIAAGVGTLSKEFVPKYHSGPEDKFDFKIVYDTRTLCFLDVTGYDNNTKMPAILSVKIKYGYIYDVLDKLWFAYVRDNTASVRFISALRVLKLYYDRLAYLKKIMRDEKPFFIVPSRYWRSVKTFIDVLVIKAHNPLKPVIKPEIEQILEQIPP